MALKLDPEIKTKIQPSSEERKRRKRSAQELSNAFGKAVGGGMSGMGQMPSSKAPDAGGLAMTAIKIYSMMGSDKKLKKNIKTISNSMEILYG